MLAMIDKDIEHRCIGRTKAVWEAPWTGKRALLKIWYYIPHGGFAGRGLMYHVKVRAKDGQDG
jgi:hypothetical protein